MSTPNPLVPEGSLQQSKGKSNVKIAVFTILAIHAVLLVGLLMQGCKEKPKTVSETDITTATNDTASVPPLAAPTETTVGSTVPATPTATPATPVANNTAAVAPSVPTSNLTAITAPVSAPVINDTATTVASAQEHTIAAGETLGKIAKDNHISLKALLAANPNVNPTKLKIGQKIQIPAPASAPATETAKASSTDAADASAEGLYVVKSGDVLERIAKTHGTSVKAIKTANNLKTDRLKVGQKLKVPPAKTATASTEAAPVAETSTLTPTALVPSATMAAATTK